jgi:bacillithiol biosynthesis deacetylase BshB1
MSKNINENTVDVMAIGAHPDDCEMFVGGTLLRMKSLSYRVGICDLSQGEAATYGTPGTRRAELEKATSLLGVDMRVTLDFPDGHIRDSRENRLKIIDVIRKHRPELVFSFADRPLRYRHPDHYYCAKLVSESCYLAGLEKIETGTPPFRPSAVIGFPELIFEDPHFVIDVTDFWETRQEAIRCFQTQVLQPGEDDSQTRTFIRSSSFWDIQEARGTMAGALIGVRYGEPFYCDHPPQVLNPMESFKRKLK